MIQLFSEPGFFNDWQVILLSPWSRPTVALFLALALGALWLTWRSYRRQRRRRRRVLLTALRGGTLTAVLLLLLEPAIQLRNVTTIPNHVAVLVDDSRSMSLRENDEGPSRGARAVALLRRSRSTLQELGRNHHIDFYRFSDDLRPSTREQLFKPTGPPQGPATRLQVALQRLRSRHVGRNLGGVVVISDGADNGVFGSDGLDEAGREAVRALDVPVHTVWLGTAGLRDVAVSAVRADTFAFVHVALVVDAVVKVAGYPGQELAVSLKQDGQVIRTKRISVEGDAATIRVPFEFTPDRRGKFVYTVETPVLTGEAVHHNNAHTFVLNVIRDKVRVLQVCGRPSYDERFLRAMLKRDPNVDLISFFILRTPTDITMVPSDELSLIPFPTQELFEQELKSFDLVILQNFNFAPYGMAPYLHHVRRYVREGGALAMIGGDQSFTSGGYARTPVAEVLPVKLLPSYTDVARLISEEPFRPVLTAAGRGHPITAVKLNLRENEARLNALPQLEGVNRVGPAKPNATVLLSHPFLVTGERRPMPVLAVMEAGAGRTLALTTDTLWHWGFLAAGEEGAARQAGDDGRTYVKLWDNAIRWLIRDPALRYLRVDPDRSDHDQGQPVHLTVRAWLPDYRPARSLKVALEVRPIATGEPATSQPANRPVFSSAALTDQEGEIHVELPPPAPGAYRVTARATMGDRPLSDESAFIVTLAGRELADPAARDATLRAVADASGGTFLAEPRTLPALRMHPPRVVRVGRHRDVELWSRGWALVATVLLLTIEWLLRRRWGHL